MTVWLREDDSAMKLADDSGACNDAIAGKPAPTGLCAAQNVICSAQVQVLVNDCHMGMSVIMLQLSFLSKSPRIPNARSLSDHAARRH